VPKVVYHRDEKALGKFKFAVGFLGKPQFFKDLTRDISKDIKRDIEVKFSKGRDPYGLKWKPRKHIYPWPILNRTGNLRRSLRAVAANNKITIAYVADYSDYVHEERTLVPENVTGGLPKDHRKIIKRAFSDAIKRATKSAGGTP